MRKCLFSQCKKEVFWSMRWCYNHWCELYAKGIEKERGYVNLKKFNSKTWKSNHRKEIKGWREKLKEQLMKDGFYPQQK